jgi:hypothetical protein
MLGCFAALVDVKGTDATPLKSQKYNASNKLRGKGAWFKRSTIAVEALIFLRRFPFV